MDRDGNLRRANGAFARLLGYRADQLEGRPVSALLRPNQRSRFRRARQLVLNGADSDETCSVSLHWMASSGRMIRTRASVERGPEPGELHVRVGSRVARKSADRLPATPRLDLPATWMQATLEAASNAMLIVDERGRIRFCNLAAERLFERSRAWLCNTDVDHLFDADARDGEPEISRRVEGVRRRETPERFALVGSLEGGRTVELMVTPLEGTGEPLCLLEIFDVTDARQREAQVRYLSSFDSLTGLPNRELFLERLDTAVRRSSDLTVIYMDVDRFKNLNEALGHHAGDDVLCEIAERVKSLTGLGDTIARLGGDEFGLLLEGKDSERRAASLSDRLAELVGEAMFADGREVFLTACAGVAVRGCGGQGPESLLRNAEIALYESKRHGRNAVTFYHEGLEGNRAGRLRMEVELRHALDRGELTPFYQPIQRAGDRDAFAVEALMRWHHPERGLVSPADFIVVLEETGLIRDAGGHLLRQACRDVRDLRAGDGRPLRLSVNVSAVQMRDSTFVDRVSDILDELGFEASRLTLEITESLLMEHSVIVRHNLQRFRNMAVEIAVDDFGTGYSSLAYLKRFPVTALKIDRSFVSGIGEGSDDGAIVAAIVAMARSLGLSLVAEGVETPAQASYLAQWPDVALQGYLFAPPLPFAEIGEWVAGRRLLNR